MQENLSHQEEFALLLKKKGVGPKGSKSLTQQEAGRVLTLFMSDTISLTTKSTMLTALLLLDPTDQEKTVLEHIHSNPEKYLPADLLFFIQHSKATKEVEKAVLKIISGDSLDRGPAYALFNQLLTSETPDYLMGAFLEAERLKRETFDENMAFFQAIWDNTVRKKTSLPLLIDIADSYDGYNRSHFYSPFVAATLAALGYPVLLHGTDKVAPKEGLTALKLLDADNKNTALNHNQCIERLENKYIGWCFLHQNKYHPLIEKLKRVRKEMVKRPFLATFEKLCQPIIAIKGNHLFTGYTHKHYREEVVKLLQSHGKSSVALNIKGVEGSSMPSLSRNTDMVKWNGASVDYLTVNPAMFGIQYTENKVNHELTAAQLVKEGLNALNGEKDHAFYQIKYHCCIILQQVSELSPEDIGHSIEESIMSGRALQHYLSY